jgi:DNA-binding response OmpR family regulator/anti-sigma regulatory factor (Ser/Thr protein kinase)
VEEDDLTLFLERVVQSFQSWAERKRITLSVRCDKVTARGWYDAETLEKILNNLISNALKFTPEGGHVVVTGETTGNALCIVVEDTGVGIAAEHVPRIFDRFYMVDESHRREGTGIGLALTKELVELHHGTISVRSESGKGATFTLRVPIDRKGYQLEEIATVPRVVEEEGTQAPVDLDVFLHSPAQPENRDRAEKAIVLVVEDNADVRAYIRSNVEVDFSVEETEDGRKGFEKSCEVIPDLVVTDVMMPGMDGYELTRALKEDERTSHIPVILLTARAESESRIKGLETGADDYLTKPFDAKELLTRIRNLIELRRKLREKFSRGVELKPGEVAVTSLDDLFLNRVMAAVEKNMAREEFVVEDFAREVFLSRIQLYRKLRALTNMTPVEFIKRMRLQRARELLEKNFGTVAEIADSVGFSNHSYFARCFQEQFGVPPAELRRRQ